MKKDKALMRAAVVARTGPIDWRADVHTLTNSQRVDLTEIAKQFGYRKSTSSYFSLGAAFFVYLSKGMDVPPAKTPGGKWNNHTIARG